MLLKNGWSSAAPLKNSMGNESPECHPRGDEGLARRAVGFGRQERPLFHDRARPHDQLHWSMPIDTSGIHVENTP